MADPYRRDPEVRARSGVSPIVIAIIVIALVAFAAWAFGLIGVHQTKEAKLPEVSVKGGQAPAFDVNTAKVDVGSKKEPVEVPKVDVSTTKTNVSVPTVDVKPAH